MEPTHIGRYEIHTLLGQGGMGTVYKARDPWMDRWVALKTITVQDTTQRARFRQEVQAAGKLNHLHITTIYDVGEVGDLAYIVMELVEGDTLAGRLSSPVPWPEAIELLLPICQALAYAHSQGVVHRDVKPANILISAGGQVKLTDFGVARLEAALRRITESGSTVGTPLYTAPEQIRNEVVDGRADLFSLGIVLYELITNQHPFIGETLAQIVYQITQSEPAKLEPLIGVVPPAVIALVERALSKDRIGRFTDANEMAQALTTCLQQPEFIPTSYEMGSPREQLSYSPVSSRSPSSGLPILDVVASNLSLSPAEEVLLRKAFAGHDRVFLEREFSSGYSGARVLLVTPVRSGRRLAQIVLKLDRAAAVEGEWQAYQEFVKDTLPPVTARILEEPLKAEESPLALLQYTFAGGLGHQPPESLRTYYTQNSGEEIAALLEKGVFRAFASKWWRQRRATDLILRREYDRLLPVHLVVEKREVGEATVTPRIITAGKIAAHAFRQLEPDQLVQLQGFTIEEIQAAQSEITLQGPPPSGSSTNPIRIRLTGLSPYLIEYQIGQRAPVLIGAVKATRHDLLLQSAQPALPGQDLNQKGIKIGGRSYPNPLSDYDVLMDQHVSAMTSIIHGDLNFDNILVTPSSRLAWLIDFATTRDKGHNVYDFMRLETQVITKLLPQSRLGPEAAAQLMQALHEPDTPPTRLPGELQKPFIVLAAIRRMVRVCMYNQENWDEYYLGLVLMLLGSLKFKELTPLARGMALAAAATVRGLITMPALRIAPDPTPDPPPSVRPKPAVLVAGAVFVLIALVGLASWASGLFSSATPTPTLQTPIAVVTSLTSTATWTPTILLSPSPVASVTEMVLNQAAAIYGGPGSAYPKSGSVPAGNRVQVMSRSADGMWLQIEQPDEPGNYGWIPAEAVAETVTPSVATLEVLPTIEVAADLSSPSPTLTPTEPAVVVTSTLTPCASSIHYADLSHDFPNLGCVLNTWQSDFTFQRFEKGLMVWRKTPAPAQIYVLPEEGNWLSQEDPQGPAQPTCWEAEETDGLGPILSFGVIWCNGQKERLGLPLTKEMASEDSLVETFEGGLVFTLDRWRYILSEEGDWTSVAPDEPGQNEPIRERVEDFESYQTASLQQVYTLNSAWDKNSISIEITHLPDAADQGQGLALAYDIKAAAPDNYVGLERTFPAVQNWSSFGMVRLWVRNDGTPKELIFQWGEVQNSDGEVWKSLYPLEASYTGFIDFPLTSQFFKWADWSQAGNGQMDLAQVSQYAFFIAQRQPGRGVIYLDSVELVAPSAPPSTPATATPKTLECQTSAAPEFQALWNKHSQALGCPTTAPETLAYIVEENFQGGHLIWREDTDDVYLIYDRQQDGTELFEGEWQKPPWKWDGQAVCHPWQSPAPGLYGPERGFGWLWCTHLGGPEGRLGWALDKEKPFNNVGRVQLFEQGLIFKGNAPKVYALLKEGRFWAEGTASGQRLPVPSNHQATGFQPDVVFTLLWDQLGGGNSALGYPLGAAITDRNYARQPFEHGFMFWWESLEQPQPIWVIDTPDPLATSGDTWVKYDNRWQAGQPEYPPDCPEAGPPLGPKNGFGLVWCYEAGVKAQVGRPLKEEVGSGNALPKGVVQFFQGGLMVENPTDRQVWALIDSGGWYQLSY